MTKSIPEDLRSRVIAAVDGGLSRSAGADRFGVAVVSAVRWVRDWRETGSTRVKPQGGDMRSQRIEAHRDGPGVMGCNSRRLAALHSSRMRQLFHCHRV